MKILFDTNVVLDAITERYNDSQYAKLLISYLLQDKIKGYILTSQITDIYYCLRKYWTDEKQKREFIKLICNSFILIPPGRTNIITSCDSNINDFEDALIDNTARVNGVQYIATNNIKDFANSKLLAITPRELCELIELKSKVLS